MPKEKSNIAMIVLFSAVFLIAGGVAGFFLHNIIAGRTGGRDFGNSNFQLSQEQISNVTDFFNSNPDSTQTEAYCSQNRGMCFYYCRQVNPNADYCSQMMSQLNTNRGQTSS